MSSRRGPIAGRGRRSRMRFTLMNRRSNTAMRMEMDPDDRVLEIVDAASEAWGCGTVVLRDGYSLLDPDSRTGSCIAEGDLVEVLPDPFGPRRWRDILDRSRRLSHDRHGRKDGDRGGRDVRLQRYGGDRRCGGEVVVARWPDRQEGGRPQRAVHPGDGHRDRRGGDVLPLRGNGGDRFHGVRGPFRAGFGRSRGRGPGRGRDGRLQGR